MPAESSGSDSGYTQLRRSSRTTTSTGITTSTLTTTSSRTTKSTRGPGVRVRRRQYTDSSAGLRLISSDGVTFYADLDIVRAADVRLLERFRIKVEEGDADVLQIVFHDEELERSEILLDLLDLYHGDPFPDFFSWDELMHLRQVIRLARSLDSQATLHTISDTLRLRLLEDRNDRNWPFGIFVLSSTMDNVELCAAAISKARDLSWESGVNPSPATPVDDVVIGESSFDPWTWPGEFYQIIPGRGIAALLRAIREGALPLGEGTDWDAVAGRFLENLTPATE